MRQKIKVIKRTASFGIGSALLSALFTNCAPAQFQNVAEIQALSELNVETQQGEIKGPSTPGRANPNIQPIKQTCASGLIKRSVVSISFPNPVSSQPASTCGFGVADNGGPANDHFSARVEQNVDFALPTGAKICSMEFQVNEQTITYDDHIFLVFDDSVIMASTPFESYLPVSDGIFTWDWSYVSGKSWKLGNETNYSYCLGEIQGLSQCRFPQTQQQGVMRLEFDPAIFQGITARNFNRPIHTFKFVTMGDNDPQVDCQHSPISFAVTVSYAEM